MCTENTRYSTERKYAITRSACMGIIVVDVGYVQKGLCTRLGTCVCVRMFRSCSWLQDYHRCLHFLGDSNVTRGAYSLHAVNDVELDTSVYSSVGRSVTAKSC